MGFSLPAGFDAAKGVRIRAAVVRT